MIRKKTGPPLPLTTVIVSLTITLLCVTTPNRLRDKYAQLVTDQLRNFRQGWSEGKMSTLITDSVQFQTSKQKLEFHQNKMPPRSQNRLESTDFGRVRLTTSSPPLGLFAAMTMRDRWFASKAPRVVSSGDAKCSLMLH